VFSGFKQMLLLKIPAKQGIIAEAKIETGLVER
jgi:hypothetical protein